jgi:hypothetical protein
MQTQFGGQQDSVAQEKDGKAGSLSLPSDLQNPNLLFNIAACLQGFIVQQAFPSAPSGGKDTHYCTIQIPLITIFGIVHILTHISILNIHSSLVG